MKDKVITLSDEIKAYVLDELDYKNKKFIFVVELDENDEPIQENVHTLEIVVENDKLLTNKIEDFETASIINNMFISKAINGE